MKHTKLFIPGPVEVSEPTLRAFASPQIGHRGGEFMKLYADLQPKLQQLFFTKQPVFLSTSSAWGVMEAALRNLVVKKVLCCGCGAFSDKWYDVALSCDKEAESLKVEWGQPILPEQVEERLRQGGFDAVTVVHNETSTGVMNPVADIAAVIKKFPEVLLIVDAVSSLGGVKIETDVLGLDVLLAGTQKALALPAGMAVFSVSQRAMKRAATVKGRGYYFDFLEFQKNHEKNQTPSTPSIGHIFALKQKMDEMMTEGLAARFARHLEMATLTRAWVRGHGFEMFPRSGYESVTLSCVKNTRGIDVARLKDDLKKLHGVLIDGGYGAIQGKSFRLAHMGDETPKTVQQLLAWIEELLSANAVNIAG
jgi:aspartate aminotransferase-like enzyme